MTNGLSFNTLRQANLKRLPTFKNKHGELAHSEADGSDWTPAQWLQAVVGELGEYANKRKKFERGDLTQEEFVRLGGKELADVQTYLDILAFSVGVDLGQATVDKFNEISDRVDSPICIGWDGDWHLRDDIKHGKCAGCGYDYAVDSLCNETLAGSRLCDRCADKVPEDRLLSAQTPAG